MLDPSHRSAWRLVPKANKTAIASSVLHTVHEAATRLGCRQFGQSSLAINVGNIDLQTFVFEQNKLLDE